MVRRVDVPSRVSRMWAVFCLMLCGLGFLGSARGATIPVTNTNDSGSGSLRAAITTANADSGDTINITATGTITLLSALPAIAADVTITGPGATSVTVSGNNSTTVGTIFTINSGATVSMSGLTIANGNSNAVNAGGGILNDGTLTVNNCTISGNSGIGSGNEGGGITNFGTLTVSTSTVSGNSGSEGGGIFNGQTNTLTVVNSTFSGNSVTTKGGGIYNYPGGTLTVTSSTISANSASEDGGGVETNGTTTTITNSIVAGNTAAANDDVDGTYTDGGGNLVGTSGINLAPLANYGGPTQTMLPLPNSPALCAGTPTALITDQRGFPVGASGYCTSGKIDSGAVQTNYTAIQFTNAGANGYAAAVNSAVAFPAAPIVSVTENGQNIGGVSVTLTFNGAGTATGLGPITTVAGTGATFNSISVNEAGTDTLDAQLTLRSTILDTSANLKVVMITLTPAAGALSGATKGEPYSMLFIASGGTTSTYTYTHSISSGAFPTGLNFNDGTATLSGTPTATGSVGFAVTATDSNGFSGSQSYSLTVNPSVAAQQSIATKILTVNQASASFTPVTGSRRHRTPELRHLTRSAHRPQHKFLHRHHYRQTHGNQFSDDVHGDGRGRQQFNGDSILLVDREPRCDSNHGRAKQDTDCKSRNNVIHAGNGLRRNGASELQHFSFAASRPEPEYVYRRDYRNTHGGQRADNLSGDNYGRQQYDSVIELLSNCEQRGDGDSGHTCNDADGRPIIGIIHSGNGHRRHHAPQLQHLSVSTGRAQPEYIHGSNYRHADRGQPTDDVHGNDHRRQPGDGNSDLLANSEQRTDGNVGKHGNAERESSRVIHSGNRVRWHGAAAL